MNMKILRLGTREAVRHPGGAARLFKYRRALMAAAGAAGHARQYGTSVRETATNPKVRAETRLAMASLILAGQRARKLGLVDATGDKRVIAQLRQAQRHAGRAVTTVQRERRRRRVVHRAVLLAGAGALSGAAYAGWKVRAQPEPTQTDTPVAV
jgi:hypothetical protein